MDLAVADRDTLVALPMGREFADYALAAEKPAAPAKGRSRRFLYLAAAFSLGLHLAIILFSVLKLGGLGERPPDVQKVGMEEGIPENVPISVITAADLKSLTSAVAPPETITPPSPSKETPPDPAPPQEQQQQPEEAKARESESHSSPIQALPGLEEMAARFADAFTAAVKQAPTHAEQRTVSRSAVQRVSPRLNFSRPGASHSGKSDEFARGVAWALAATVPQGNGTYGSTIVTFIVSANGQVQDLHLLKSSGDKWLDTSALMAVKQAHLPAPPSGLDTGDRTFNVEYISR